MRKVVAFKRALSSWGRSLGCRSPDNLNFRFGRKGDPTAPLPGFFRRQTCFIFSALYFLLFPVFRDSPAAHVDQARLCGTVDVEPKSLLAIVRQSNSRLGTHGEISLLENNAILRCLRVSMSRCVEFQERLLPFSGWCHHLWRRNILEIETAPQAGVFYFFFFIVLFIFADQSSTTYESPPAASVI